MEALPWGPESVRQELRESIELGVLQVLCHLQHHTGARPQAQALLARPQRGRLAAQLEGLLGFTTNSSEPRPRSSSQALRARRLLALLDSIHGLLCSGRHATCRELYYRCSVGTLSHSSSAVIVITL